MKVQPDVILDLRHLSADVIIAVMALDKLPGFERLMVCAQRLHQLLSEPENEATLQRWLAEPEQQLMRGRVTELRDLLDGVLGSGAEAAP